MFYALQLVAIAAGCCLLPPLAVFLATGFSSELIISILLCVLFWFPSTAYSAWVCWTRLLA